MKLVTAEEMRWIDQTTIEEIRIPGVVLMENAGRGVAEQIRTHYPSRSREVWVFSGKGNNGGDGFVIARYLHAWDYPVRVFLLAPAEAFRADAATHLHAIRTLGIEPDLLSTSDALAALDWEGPGLLVDAIFGTGLKGAVQGFPAEMIDAINRADRPVVSVDIPSGLDADTGQSPGVSVQATHTVTIALPKRGLVFSDAVGSLHVADIGFPPSVIERRQIPVELTEETDVRARLPKRPRRSHKGTFGRVLCLAGSCGMTGAAALCSEAALRSGAGLVTLGVPASLNDVLEVKLTEVMTLPLAGTDLGSLSREAAQQIETFAAKMDVFALGPGLSQHPETAALIQHLSVSLPLPGVIDADGLNALARTPEALGQMQGERVLTPHYGEMARLLGIQIEAVQQDPIRIAQKFAREHGVTLVLKGAPTVIARPDGRVWVNTTGNPGMATAGAGDVLTGLIAGLIAQGMSAADAAWVAVYIHGAAGDRAAARLGAHGLLAGDILASVPAVMRRLSADEHQGNTIWSQV